VFALRVHQRGPVHGGVQTLARRKADPPAVTFMLGLTAPRSGGRNRCTTGGVGPHAVASPIRLESSVGVLPAVCRARHRRSCVLIWIFAKSLPADEPAPMLDTVKYFSPGKGPQSYERQSGDRQRHARGQARTARTPERGALAIDDAALNWGATLCSAREDALADVGLGWPLCAACRGTRGGG